MTERSKAGVCYRSLAGNCGFESCWVHGYLSVLSVLCISGSGLCDKPISCPEESYRLLCVIVCEIGTSRMRRSWPALGCSARGINKYIKALIFKIVVIKTIHIINCDQCRTEIVSL